MGLLQGEDPFDLGGNIGGGLRGGGHGVLSNMGAG